MPAVKDWKGDPIFPTIEVCADELLSIRMLSDHGLSLLLSETHDSGWPAARILLALMAESGAYEDIRH